MTASILIVDDDPLMRKSIANLLRREGYEIIEAAGGQEALDELEHVNIDLVVTDLHMEPISGIDLLKTIKSKRAELEVIVITAFGTIDVAVEAMKLKAFDFITKPFQPDEILTRIGNAIEKTHLKEAVNRLQTEALSAFGIEGIIGQSESLRKLLSIVPRVAQTDSTVLITGENGTGKELIARAIVAASRRAKAPFVSVSCAAFPEHLLESELFGYEKGAHSTAFSARKGLFEEAHHGTFFLDEIGEAPLPAQAKLLRVLEERCIRRLGGNREIPIDVRIVAATNQHLEDLITAGKFRADLFYRLNVVRLRVPPLRERTSDIPLLVAHFMNKYNQKTNRRIDGVSAEAKALLTAYSWPGNVRELENVIQSMIAVAPQNFLNVDDLPDEIRGGAASQQVERNDFKDNTKRIREEIEKQQLHEALVAHKWNITHTARALKISRATIQNKMKTYDMRFPKK